MIMILFTDTETDTVTVTDEEKEKRKRKKKKNATASATTGQKCQKKWLFMAGAVTSFGGFSIILVNGVVALTGEFAEIR